MNQVNALGLSCPEPIICLRKALQTDASGVCIAVDDVCAVENITRYARNNGYTIQKKEKEHCTELTLEKKP